MTTSAEIAQAAGAAPVAAHIKLLEKAAHVPVLGALARLLPQLSRYTLVSAVALGVDFTILIALSSGFGLKASLAGMIGYAVGLIVHFALSTRFVFTTRSAEKSRPRLFAEFVASGLIGLGITGLVMWIAADVAGAPAPLAKAAAVGISFFAVFLLRRTIVFAARG